MRLFVHVPQTPDISAHTDGVPELIFVGGDLSLCIAGRVIDENIRFLCV